MSDWSGSERKPELDHEAGEDNAERVAMGLGRWNKRTEFSTTILYVDEWSVRTVTN